MTSPVPWFVARSDHGELIAFRRCALALPVADRAQPRSHHTFADIRDTSPPFATLPWCAARIRAGGRVYRDRQGGLFEHDLRRALPCRT